MSADPVAVPAACPECNRLRQTARQPATTPEVAPRPGALSHPLTRLARHLANRHLDLVPGWVEGCARCDELSTTLREAADRGLLGAGAAQAGAEHRALHLLTGSAGTVR
ncbi:hypothetical protein [Streptomyces sp. NRRL S-87]|uniref:hypothetical protein n=1 Tax=Streptomyces sp. NRRL S-87 TaxID=1463920 RepID=UPI0004C18649|nr:hypothetical protein [Streptomyces sp. NRRL S-87]